MIGSAITTVLYWGAFVGLIGWEGSRGARERRRRRREQERREQARQAERERWRRVSNPPPQRERIETLPSGRQIRVVTAVGEQATETTPPTPVTVAVPSAEELEPLLALPCAADREPWVDLEAFRAQRAAIRRLPMTEEPGVDF